MEYKELIERLKKETYWVGGSHPYSHDVHPLICDEAADAITALLARTEEAESRCEILEKAIKEISNIAIPGDQRIEDGAEQVVMFCGVPFEEAIKRVLEFPKMEERAEAAEKELTECKEKNAGLALALLTEQPPNADCLGDLEWEKIRSRFKAEEERAKKAEMERDAAVKELNGVSTAVDDLDNFIDDHVHPFTPYDVYIALRDNVDDISVWKYESEWKGQEEE